MLESRRIRIAIGIFIVAAIWNMMWPRATSYVSTDAVVDAPILTVRAPRNGTIVRPSTALGTGISADTILLELGAHSAQSDAQARLSAEIQTARAETIALSSERRATLENIARLKERAEAEQRLEIGYLTHKLAEARGIRLQRSIAWDRAQSDLDRAQSLFARGTLSDIAVRNAELEVSLADARLTETDAFVRTVQLELEAIEAGLLSPAGTGSRNFALNRIEDMRLHLNDLTTRVAISSERLRGLEQRAERASGGGVDIPEFAPLAAANGVIWQASPPAGASAAEGTELASVLDCSRRFLEVTLSEAVFEQIDIGLPARVRLKGARDAFTTQVALRRASGVGTALTQAGEAAGPETRSHGIRVYLELPPVDSLDPDVASRFCDVGRTAEVLIPRPVLNERLSDFASRMKHLLTGTQEVALRFWKHSTG